MNNLSEEEKKEYIEHEILDRLYCVDENDFDKDKVDESYIKAVLNACKEAKKLIENQQKEIEELKDTRSIFNMGRRSYKNEIESKIREIIEGDYTDLGKILEIEKLLEE